ncbi:hypothetical protein [Bacillus pinisoli]|uniref:hypothetical protein n=1 Tax=Bacillus pinisoli TaxID=2901866 RepID=UPI001FF57D74|nr:hypothetical protein [Bacillus pinisoli]
MKKIISLLLLSTILLLAACSEKSSLEEQVVGDKGNAEKTIEEQIKTLSEKTGKPQLSLLNEEELVKWYFKFLNNKDTKLIEEIAVSGQEKLIQEQTTIITEHLKTNEIQVNFLETIELLTSGDTRAIIYSTEILNMENERIQVEINTLSLLKQEDGYKLVFDANQLSQEHTQSFVELQQQLNKLVQQDEEMQKHLAWVQEQNQVHQQALQDHMNAHQQFMDQSQQQQMQQMQQQMMPPPSGF